MYLSHTDSPIPHGTKEGDRLAISIVTESGVEDYACEWVPDREVAEGTDGYWYEESKYGGKSFYPAFIDLEAGTLLLWHRLQHCCASMQVHVMGCTTPHHEGEECPDVIVDYDPRFSCYSLPNCSRNYSSELKFCPWCGMDIGTRQDEWWQQITRIFGYRPRRDEVETAREFGKIPAKYFTDAWWRNPSE